MRRIAIMNQKGGVGKTTTTVNLGAALARAGHRVWLIDLDPQAHLTMHLGLDPTAEQAGTYAMLTRSVPLADARQQVRENLWVVPSHVDLAAAEIELVSVVGRELILRDGLDANEDEADFVLMDCPPSLGVLTLNALAAAAEVMVPLQPHVLALQGMGKLLETVALVSQRLNRNLKVTGIVMCMNEHGTRLAAEVVDDLRGFLDEARGTSCPWADARIFRTAVRRNIKLAEAPGYGQSIFEYAPSSNGAWDYAAIAAELVDPEVQLAPAPDGAPADTDQSSDATPVAEPAPVVKPTLVPEPEPAAIDAIEIAVPEFGPIPVVESNVGKRRSWAPQPTPPTIEEHGVAGLHADLASWGSWPDLGQSTAQLFPGEIAYDASFVDPSAEDVTLNHWVPLQQPAA